MADDAPQWLREAFEAQARQLAELAAQQANTMASLASRIDDIEERRSTLPVPPVAHTPNTTTREPTPEPAAYTKPRLPNPEKFDGTDLALYPQFEGLLRAKLEIDATAIGGEREKVWYGFGRLSGDAAGRIFPWMGYAQREGQLTVDGLFKQMGTAFRDPRHQQKALSQLNKIKQGARPFNEFLNEFNRLILEAEGWGWADVIKKGYLKAAIATALVRGTVGMKEEQSYEEYCSQLRMVSDQLAEVKELSARGDWWRQKSGGHSSEAVQAPADSMEWEATTATATAPMMKKESRWASREEIERRRKQGLCLRCGRDGHMVRDCHAKLAKGEKKKALVTAAGKTKRTETRNVEVKETSSESEGSGKE
jgi:hypothetical protein